VSMLGSDIDHSIAASCSNDKTFHEYERFEAERARLNFARTEIILID